jgi:heme oxygenase
MGLYQDTLEKHKTAERMSFNIKMIKGELLVEQYIEYLIGQYFIFSTIENNFQLPHPELKRSDVIKEDLVELGVDYISTPLESIHRYTEYLMGLSQDDINPHIYLHYLAIVFGGQIIKQKIHGSGRMYDFANMEEVSRSIRYIQQDSWKDEVNKGYDFIIDIFRELETL